MKKAINKAVARLGTVLLGVLVCLLTLLLVVQGYNKWIRHDETAGIFGYNHKTVLTGSMEPAIPVGSIVVIKRQDRYAVGEVIAFQEGQSIITHRIIQKEQEHFLTKGDANHVADTETVEQEQILGKVILTIPLFGYLVIGLLSPIGIIALLAVAGIWYRWSGRNRNAGNEGAENEAAEHKTGKE